MCRGVTARFVNLSSQADQSSVDSMDVDFFPIESCRALLTTQLLPSRTFDFHLTPFSDPVKILSILIRHSYNQYGISESDRSLFEVLVSQHHNFTPPSVHLQLAPHGWIWYKMCTDPSLPQTVRFQYLAQ